MQSTRRWDRALAHGAAWMLGAIAATPALDTVAPKARR